MLLHSSTNPFFDRYAVLRWFLAMVLLVAAALKGIELAMRPTGEQDLFSARSFMIALVEFELLAGLWLLSGLAPHITRRAAIVVFAIFAAVSLYKAATGATSCGCFGQIAVSPWITLAFNLTAATLMARTKSPAEANEGRPSAARLVLRAMFVLVTWLLLGTTLGLLIAGYRPARLSPEGILTGGDGIVLLEPEKWIGYRLPLIKHVDIGSDLVRGRWTLLLYHHDCPKCLQAILRLRDKAAADVTANRPDKVAVIEMPPFGEEVVKQRAYFRYGRLRADREWFASTPVEIVISDGIVVRVNAPSHDQVKAAEFPDAGS